MLIRYTVILMICFNYFVFAQDFPGGANPNDNRTNKSASPGLYAGFAVKGANLMDDWGVELGARLGGFLDDHFIVGAGLYYLFTQTIHYKTYDSSVEPHLRLAYGGAEGELHLNLHKHVSISAFLGAYIGQINEGVRSDIDISHDLVGDWMYSLEPGISLYVRILENISIGLSYHYRSSFDVDFKTLTNDDLSGHILSLSILSISD